MGDARVRLYRLSQSPWPLGPQGVSSLQEVGRLPCVQAACPAAIGPRLLDCGHCSRAAEQEQATAATRSAACWRVT